MTLPLIACIGFCYFFLFFVICLLWCICLQGMIEGLLMLLRDPDYRVRFFLARRIGVLFQTWDGHKELFQDIWCVPPQILLYDVDLSVFFFFGGGWGVWMCFISTM